MKQFRLISCHLLIGCLLIIGLFSELQARRLFLNTNSGFFCRWSQKKICSKKTPVCVQLVGATTSTCTYYFNQCQYLIDKCLSQTDVGTSGSIVAATVCTSKGVTLGQTGDCT